MKVYLKNNIIQNTEIGDMAKLVYISFRTLMDSDSVQVFEIEDIIKIIRGKKERKDRAVKKFEKGIQELANIGLINVLGWTDKELKADVSKLIFSTSEGNFFIIEKSILNQIKEIESIRYGEAIVYFCVLISTINSKSKLGKTGMRKLSQYTGYAPATLIKLNGAFEVNNLICIDKGNQYRANKYSICEIKMREEVKGAKVIETDIVEDIEGEEFGEIQDNETDDYSFNPYL